MNSNTPRIAALAAALATAFACGAAQADTPAPNDGMRYVGVDTQADNRGNQQVLSTVSLPVGRNAWVQAGAGKSRSNEFDSTQRPGILTGAVGLAGQAYRLTVNTSQRFDGSRYRQSGWGSSLDWRHDGNLIGLDLTHRHEQAIGTAALNGQGGSTPVPTQAQISGSGFGMHGGLQVNEHLSVYAALARNHYKSSVQQIDSSAPGGLLAASPLLGQGLFGRVSVVNLDEVALDHSAQLGTTYRWSKLAVSGEYTTAQVHDNGGAMRSVDVKAAFDVAPGWRLASGLGRSTSDQGGHANFALLSASYGW
jgi:hypothetical protein